MIFGLLGPNGAGKSTTVKTITGAIKPTEGRIIVDGLDITKDPEKVKSRIGYVPENPDVFPNLTGREYLFLTGQLYHITGANLRAKIEALLRRFELIDRADEQIASYSKGMTQKLVIASAIMHNPANLILDEPLSGLDAKSAAILKEVIRSFARQGRTVLFSSHVIDVVEKLCDEIAIMNGGTILATGKSETIVKESGCENLESAFIKLTGETDVTKEAEIIVSSIQEA